MTDSKISDERLAAMLADAISERDRPLIGDGSLYDFAPGELVEALTELIAFRQPQPTDGQAVLIKSGDDVVVRISPELNEMIGKMPKSAHDMPHLWVRRQPQPVNEPAGWQVEKACAEYKELLGREVSLQAMARILRAASLPKVDPGVKHSTDCGCGYCT